MKFKDSKYVNIIYTNKIYDKYLKEDIKKNINFCNGNIYFICDDKVYGKVSIFNTINCLDDYVTIDKYFKSIDNYNIMNVKELFKEMDEVPVVINDKLEGIYLKGTEVSSIKYFLKFVPKLYNLYNDFIIVSDEGKKYDDLFIGKNIKYITFKEFIINNNKYNDSYVLFDNDSEWDSVTLIFNLLKIPFIYLKYFSFFRFYTFLEDYTNNELVDLYFNIYMNILKDKNVNLLTISLDYKSDKYLNFRDKIKNRYLDVGEPVSQKILHPEIFFCELYSEEYMNEYYKRDMQEVHFNGYNMIRDCSSKYYNIKDHKRVTIGNDIEDVYQTIHFFGPCFFIGSFCEDKNTIPSMIQSMVNEKFDKIKVINHGAWNNALSQLKLLESEVIKENDIVVIFEDGKRVSGIDNIDLVKILDKQDLNIEWFVDEITHFNHIFNKLLSDEIYSKINKYFDDSKKYNIISKETNYMIKSYLSRYFYGYDLTKMGVVGSIVMNANPFTNGHKYLIDEALKKVDFLFVFVLSEDLSVFSFDERYACVCEALKDYNNVYVVPSGDYILSKQTFPEYFVKTVDSEISDNIRGDLDNFVKVIAPYLGIRYRFVGEELNDEVTRNYNELMKEVLPKYGIELVEIPRLKCNDNIISATIVRKYLSDNEIEKIKDYVPITTYNIIKNMIK